jgi:DNA polymerase I-like protein with 3'-5' exonuclease and polymerase domains
LYSGIFTLVTDLECNTPEKRRVGKEAFLMVVYGAGKGAVAKRLGIPEESCQDAGQPHLQRLPGGLRLDQGAVAEAEAVGTIRDYFGRRRSFSPETAYEARNFVVQGVAATVCLEILIELYKRFEGTTTRLCFSIHDGYGLVHELERITDTLAAIKNVLQRESSLCPGLRLKSECQAGIRLDELHVV